MKKKAKKTKKKQEETYCITPKGALVLEYGDEVAERIMEILELNARRLSSFKGGGTPAIIFDGSLGTFETVEKSK